MGKQKIFVLKSKQQEVKRQKYILLAPIFGNHMKRAIIKTIACTVGNHAVRMKEKALKNRAKMNKVRIY